MICIFLHQNHEELAKEIETVFPKRFEIVVYQSISEINRIMKPKNEEVVLLPRAA